MVNKALASVVKLQLLLEFTWLLETLEKHGIYFGTLNLGNSLEFCIKNLNLLEIWERQKISLTQSVFSSKFHSSVINQF